ncbi:MAG: glycosyltransferase family 2 protein [Candidatus Moranbacteria bacterium]|nr:glycosyltransferase family 2 protein [Candidatus Moranbacteria bacterium]MDD3965127.1 glycosyltransferase family 2 protein [Candidatus Moranbacteria bacterium]
MEQIFLSVIIPAYKEGERIGRNLLEIDKYLKGKNYSYEILVIVDGSPDNTALVSRNYALQIPHIRVIENTENHGKGYVVRQGLLEAVGKWRLFLDADGSTSITHLDACEEHFKSEYDVIIGSRKIAGSFVQIHQPKHREILGEGGNWLIRIILGLWNYPDTQCGFKVLSEKASNEIASRMVVDRFGFDFELVVLALRLGFQVKQLPVRWMNEEGSTVKLTGPNGFIQVLIDLFKTKWRLITGAYHISEYAKKKITANAS